MSTFSIISLCVTGVYALLKITYAFLLRDRQSIEKNVDALKVTVVVAARNESANIKACLKSLADSNYPHHLLEVIVGDDRSEDETADIIRDFVRTHPQFRLLTVTEDLPRLKAKQNVLAQLMRHAAGDVILIADADVTVRPSWVREMTARISADIPMVSGITLAVGKGLFAGIQTLDWMMGLGINRAHSRLGIPVTAVGNNMAVDAVAYRQTGGYENIPFSMTEDYKLFQAVCEKQNRRFLQLFHPAVLSSTRPVYTWKELLQQRRRWFRGGREIAVYNKLMLLFNASVVPFLILSAFLNPMAVTLVAWSLKVMADFLFLMTACVLLHKTDKMKWFPFYEIYYQVMSLVIPLQQALPGRIIWKGREI